MPGVMTPSEIEAALALGLRTLKFFRQKRRWRSHAQSVGGPYAHSEVCADACARNMADYLALPVVAAIADRGWWRSR